VNTILLPDDRRGRALVRRPSSRLDLGLLTHLERKRVDYALALEQWHAYVAAFETNGWPTFEVEPADELPDSQFVEDTMVVHRDLAVIARPGAPERQPETAGAERAIGELGYRIARIEGPGTLDGGDVLKLGNTMYVGAGCRSNEEGIRQLAEIVAPEGVTVVAVPISKTLHLKTGVTALPDGTLLGYLPVIDHPELLPELIPVSEQHGWRLILLGDNKILMSTSAPRTAQMIADAGYELVQVDVSELEKLESSVTCLSVRLREPVPCP
jgi:dimethylargininase